MGGVEDDEPPSKRMKLLAGELIGASNSLSLAESATGSLRNSMARPLPSKEDDDMIGSKGVIRRVEFVRIIAKALYSLGYTKSGAYLEEESGISLNSSLVNSFIQKILDGEWDESVETLHKIGLVEENVVTSASFLILEHKFFELLNAEKVMDALNTLRTEIAPLNIKSNRVHELSSYIVSPPKCMIDGIHDRITTSTKCRSKLLEDLQKMLPPAVMVPERRLEHLVEQALNLQRDACMFHNSFDKEMSLYADHKCGRDQIPSQTVQVLQGHQDEVWFLQFSHNGKYLASSSKDRIIIIWEVVVDGLSLRHSLSGHQKPVCYVSWSPDDCQILTCGVEEAVRRWDVSSGQCLNIFEKTGLGLVSCGWFPDGKSVFCGVTDRSICMWDLEGKELECWKGQRTLRISDLEVTGDGKWVISICKENAILLLDREARTEKSIVESQTITSFSLSKDNMFLLVNLMDQEIHLWTIAGEIKLLAKYEGLKRTRFLIRSCFGGLQQAFIASGSEDSQVYIWHKSSGELIGALAGHSGSVNSVAWNPANPHMLASASDDRTIRIWGLNAANMKHKGAHGNGVHYCNGGI